MLRWRNQEHSYKTKNRQDCLSLLTRIHHQRYLDAWSEIIRNIRKRSFRLFICLIILIIFQCPNRVYNGWNGPFPINLNEFRSRLHVNSVLPFNWRFFYSEYVQIELGEYMIDEHRKNTYRVFYGHHSFGNLLYIFNRVRQSDSDTTKTTLYVKFSAEGQSYSQQRYPYCFQSFNMNTLKCIFQELSTSSREYHQDWPEKSMYIKKIEEIYDKDPISFNKKVIKTCGILIGYLYQPMNEYVYASNSYKQHQFSDYVQIFDASSSYTPYVSYILISLFTCFLCKFAIDVVKEIMSLINTPLPIIHSSIAKQIRKFNFESVENLDNILFNITDENNNYHDRLFIVNGKYVVMFKINMKENKKEILRKFYENPPLIIIPIDTIKIVKDNNIILKNNTRNPWIEFPMHSSRKNFKPTDWLHQRLMIIDDQYRYNWEEEQLRHLEETQRAEEEEREYRLCLLIEEETQYQQYQNGHDINRMLQSITSASPRFIAQFRLSDRQIIPENLVETNCTICLEDFRLKPYFAQWPCQAKHMFHFDCMLDVLRAGNTCPLCRYPVEPIDLPNLQTIFRLVFRGMTPNIFH